MPPSPGAGDALFLDFDGTLVDIAPRPADVIVPAALVDCLSELQVRLDGALALVSGRPIAELDSLLAPLCFAAAGEHGAEIRYWREDDIVRASTLPPHAATAIAQLAERLEGTEVELKRASASLHYRRSPQHESAVVSGMRHLESQLDGYALILGKMVAEIKPDNIDKGLALRDLCAQPPFRGRRPVFVGDDTTDESGFVAVNELGGVSVCVGERPQTAAEFRLADVAAVHEWLERYRTTRP